MGKIIGIVMVAAVMAGGWMVWSKSAPAQSNECAQITGLQEEASGLLARAQAARTRYRGACVPCAPTDFNARHCRARRDVLVALNQQAAEAVKDYNKLCRAVLKSGCGCNVLKPPPSLMFP